MKTRIKVIEYNSGEKIYVCEKYIPFIDFISTPFFIFFFYYWFLVKWIELGEFNNLEDANKFLLQYNIEQENEIKKAERIKFNSKVKQTSFIKFP